MDATALRFCTCRNQNVVMAMATQRTGGGNSQARVSSSGNKTAVLRPKSNKSEGTSVKLLSRVEQLRLLTKAEKAGLLSAAENFGLSLSKIESLGLLSKAEDLGVLSAATDPNTPKSLLTLALALLIAGPLFVYVVPDDSAWEIALQIIVALLSVVGGPAAFAGSNLVSTLQKSN
eukprot:TRINITY_DN5010_c0_g1_i1.p1 TRINITY_DN5010_c0_g1~~TRINITY_DN5010_c0_g1_i1.p1  ORF type:complete len:196 (+),score=43.70 TRINITY_DN5010_c0_g1_i1:64-588(+)